MPKRNPGPAEAEAGAAVPDAATNDDAFIDLWLRLELRGSFDAVVEEPIPDDLLRLIEEDRAERERIRRSRAARGRRGDP